MIIHVLHLGIVPYATALELQRTLLQLRKANRIENTLLLLEHPPVITLGRNARLENVLASPEFLSQRGVELHEIDRGGDVTFHGPGQLVGYPIIDLKRHRQDLHWYLRQVEEALIRALSTVGIVGTRNPGYTGVWTAAGTKIASIGVHARDWVTWHGFALNVSTDLSYFDLIVPCGIPAVTMTSIARELGGEAPPIGAVEDAVVAAFGDVFDLAPTSASGRCAP
jgi:lipoyl(octanoyl) transferase